MKVATIKPSYLERDLIFLQDEVVTLELLELTSDYMMRGKHGNDPIEFTCNNRYARALSYILYKRHNEKSKYFKQDELQPSENKNFFIITKTLSKEQIDERLLKKFDVIKTREMGTFTIRQLEPQTR